MSLLERINRERSDEAPEAKSTAIATRSASDVVVPSGAGRRPLLVKPAQTTSNFAAVKAELHARLLEEYADTLDASDVKAVTDTITELVQGYAAANHAVLPRQDRQRLVQSLINDVIGLGPLESLLADAEVSEIMINDYDQIYIERKGMIERCPVVFDDTRQLMQVIDRIVSAVGRRVDESSPMVDARLRDGSRVNVIIPPLATKGPCMTIRKFSKDRLGLEDLMARGSCTSDMVEFLRTCVRARLNILVSGGTGSGKTTTLNALSGCIPADERIVTCEDAAELQLHQEHVVTLESRPANIEGRGRVTIRDLVVNSLRMRPDRIVVGECRGGEALDMLQAMNTGHDGSMTTLHANNARDAMSRIETMVLMSGTELPSRAIREQIVSAIDIVVHQSRVRGGLRRIVSISEVVGITDGEIQLQDLFTYHQLTVRDGKALGYHSALGRLPLRMPEIIASGEQLAEAMFAPTPEPGDEEQLY